jgi:DNA-directed RNA polymerase subunit RPC12/RpoP
MYNEQIEKLINLALADGELTEKEKQILFKKAEAAGIDLDEFELVLDAKLFEKQKNDKTDTTTPKSDKLGDVIKCPACGAIAETFATKCSDCGTEFRNIEASQNIINFFEKLDDLESSRMDSIYVNTDKSNIGIGTILKYWFFWPFLIPLKLLAFITNKSKPAKWSTTDSRKEELILNFPVPVSREEILEFLNLALSKINSNTYFNTFSEETKYKDAWNKIWLKKIEQIHFKASIAMKNDKKSFEDVIIITESARLTLKNNNKKVLHIALGFVTLVVVLFTWITVSSKMDEGNLNQQKELKLKAENFIKSGEYSKAEEIILSLEDESFIIELQSKIQLEELTKEINALEIYLENNEYSKLKLELEKITWTKNSIEYSTERIERESYKIFLEKKSALNNQLPQEYKIEIGNEYSL